MRKSEKFLIEDNNSLYLKKQKEENIKYKRYIYLEQKYENWNNIYKMGIYNFIAKLIKQKMIIYIEIRITMNKIKNIYNELL